AIQKQFVEKVAGYVDVNQVNTAQETFAYLQQPDVKVDLVFLDIYILDIYVLDLFLQLRTRYRDMDIAVVTAAAETATIAEIIRGGVVDYIVKPVDTARFRHMLMQYKQRLERLTSKEMMDQEEIDQLL